MDQGTKQSITGEKPCQELQQDTAREILDCGIVGDELDGLDIINSGNEYPTLASVERTKTRPVSEEVLKSGAQLIYKLVKIIGIVRTDKFGAQQTRLSAESMKTALNLDASYKNRQEGYKAAELLVQQWAQERAVSTLTTDANHIREKVRALNRDYRSTKRKRNAAESLEALEKSLDDMQGKIKKLKSESCFRS